MLKHNTLNVLSPGKHVAEKIEILTIIQLHFSQFYFVEFDCFRTLSAFWAPSGICHNDGKADTDTVAADILNSTETRERKWILRNLLFASVGCSIFYCMPVSTKNNQFLFEDITCKTFANKNVFSYSYCMCSFNR